MTIDEVVNLMGKPRVIELSKGVTEWHYITRGIMSDEFVAVLFLRGGRNRHKELYYYTTRCW